MTQVFLALLISLLLFACGQTPNDLQIIQELAQECVTSTIDGNFNRLVDLTYPKAVELMGGREKMIALMEKESKSAKEDGFAPLPTTVSAPTEVIKIGAQRFVIVTYQLKMKVPGGRLKRDSFLIGVIDKPGVTWTFVDGTTMDEAILKRLFPAAANKLPLPPRSEPVFEKTP
ncbi:MAG: hypothetical protein HYR56_24670 [Acidobacteria bacterium]|nr:hypothetical protein [Acidobacteriota bacterium]MBI3422696.1 hypothetical protein [Acidobacteriota bacterium]